MEKLLLLLRAGHFPSYKSGGSTQDLGREDAPVCLADVQRVDVIESLPWKRCLKIIRKSAWCILMISLLLHRAPFNCKAVFQFPYT